MNALPAGTLIANRYEVVATRAGGMDHVNSLQTLPPTTLHPRLHSYFLVLR
jgi:hypothetical protein